MSRTPVYLEVGTRRVFAAALDWPGWCRSAKTEELALAALADYHPRYAPVAKQARIAFPKTLADTFDVVERLPGNATTDFGAPDRHASADSEPVDAKEARRMAALVRAAWAVFDEVVAGAPAELRKGPRGGGRDRDKMVDHVFGAEESYARMIGIKRPPVVRDAIVELLREPSDGGPLRPNGWPARYAARRIAWHVLDHAWEIEDRSD